MNIRKLSVDECDLFKSIDRSENIRAAWQINEDGKGIASKMLELFESKIRSANKYKGIGIGNRTDNIAAGRTYEKAGFVLTKLDGLSVSRYKVLL
ncbi:MAG: hypothetical protein FWF92_03795 [Oscillospiraceae bacterium]|nr:hypothetical protein [Oscillospiraceae bacterium]